MELGLRQLIRLGRRWWWLLLIVPIACALLAYLYRENVSQRSVNYSASATLLINDVEKVGGPAYAPETYDALIQTLPQPVLQAVIDELALPYGPDELRPNITPYWPIESQVLIVTAKSDDPSQAAAIATSFAENFAVYVGQQSSSLNVELAARLDEEIAALDRQVTDLDAEIGALALDPNADAPEAQLRLDALVTTRTDSKASLARLREDRRSLERTSAATQAQLLVVENASTPEAPASQGGSLIAIVGGFAGLAIAAGIVFAFAYMDNTVKAGANFMSLAGGPLLSEIPRVPRMRPGTRQLVVLERSKSDAAESIRLLRTNVEFAAGDGELHSIAVSSPGPGEGTSTVVANLGVAMAQAGVSTLIVDADLRAPSQHRIFGVDNERGLTTLLTRPAAMSWQDVAVDTSVEGLSLIPAGPTAINPADLLSRDRFRTLIAELGRSVDLILIDTPAMLSVSDALVVAADVDGVILVCRSGRTRLDALRRAASALQQGAVRVVGVVLNQRSAGHDEAPGYQPASDGAGARAPVRIRRPALPRSRPARRHRDRAPEWSPPTSNGVQPNGQAATTATVPTPAAVRDATAEEA